jgi:DNA primase
VPFIPFDELKQRYTIEQVAQLLGLTLKRAGETFRGPCPTCGSGGERAIVITPAKGLFYCWAAHEGGDLIALAAHIRKTDAKGAAAWLAGNSENSSRDQSPKGTVPRTGDERGLKPLELEHDHVAVEALGFSAEDAAALGIGYASRGIMRGHVAVPIRLPDGTLAGYIGITEAKLPPRWHSINREVVVPLRKPS